MNNLKTVKKRLDEGQRIIDEILMLGSRSESHKNDLVGQLRIIGI